MLDTGTWCKFFITVHPPALGSNVSIACCSDIPVPSYNPAGMYSRSQCVVTFRSAVCHNQLSYQRLCWKALFVRDVVESQHFRDDRAL